VTIDLRTACECSREDIRRLSDAELLALADAVSAETGEEIVKVTDREEAIERKLARDLAEEYEETLDPAIAAELAGLPEGDIVPDQVNAALGGVETRLQAKGFAKYGAMAAAAAKVLATIGRRVGRAAVRASGRSVANVSGDLTLADKSAMDALGGQQVWWIGNFWSDHLSKTISATVTREALVGGLGRVEVGRIVNGVVSGTFPGVAVPKTFNGTPEHYFSSLAGTVRNRASNYGAIATFEEAEVKRYVISAVMDKRTSVICTFMNGRSFSVKSARRLIDRTMEADNPDAVREISPWVSSARAKDIAGEGDAGSQEAALDAAGMNLPPYHGKCRTTVVPQ
jgi:hypothetical protein